MNLHKNITYVTTNREIREGPIRIECTLANGDSFVLNRRATATEEEVNRIASFFEAENERAREIHAARCRTLDAERHAKSGQERVKALESAILNVYSARELKDEDFRTALDNAFNLIYIPERDE